MNPRLKLLFLFQTLPIIFFLATIGGYYAESQPYAWWDGTQTRYDFPPEGAPYQNLIDGITFTAFFFFVGAFFSVVLIYFDKEDAGKDDEKLQYTYVEQNTSFSNE